MIRTNAFARALGLVIVVALLGVIAPCGAQAPAPAPATLTTEKLADGIYLLRAPSTLDLWTATNVVVIVNEKDVTVFDTFTRPGTARTAIAAIKKITDKPVRTIINSHWHMDHWSGNDEFVKAWPGAQIVATTGTRDYMKHTGSGFFDTDLNIQLAGMRAALDSAIKTGKKADGTPLTAAAREQMEHDIADGVALERDARGLPRILPNVAFVDTLVLWSGHREFRLMSATGDASASTVLYLPAEKLLVTGDVLVAQETGGGPPPWTTTNYAISPWLATLRALNALDVSLIVPGQGMAFHDKQYLEITIEIYAAIIWQVHAALERGVVGVDEVTAAVNVDAIGLKYTPMASAPSTHLRPWVNALAKLVYQESIDGVSK